jgi:RHS repeat-associated protein
MLNIVASSFVAPNYLRMLKFSMFALLVILLAMVIPKSSAQTISNAGFEAGLSNWTATGGYAVFTSAAKANSGSNYAFTGVTSDLGNPSEGTLSQLITIPSSVSSAKLNFYLWIASDEDTSGDWDILKVQVLSQTGTVLRAELGSYSNRQKSGSLNSTVKSYSLYQLDLSAYIGQSIRIQFRSFPDSSINTIFRLDDVSLSITIAPPFIQTNQPVDITSSSAKLNGWTNPNGSSTNAYFQYGTTLSYGSQTPALTNQVSSVYFQSALTNLTPNTTYHYRAVATNAGGTSFGDDAAFITPPPARPNLVLNQPNGWPARLLVSKNPGNTSINLTTATSDDDLILSFVPANIGQAPTGGNFLIGVTVNEVTKETINQSQGLGTGQEVQFTNVNLGKLSVGQHNIRIELDSDNRIAEVSEGDNSFDASITITGPLGPSLTITSPSFNSSWPIGSTMPITWTLGGPTSGVTGFRVSILSNGTTFYSQNYSISVNSTSFTIPSPFATSTGSIKVEALGNPGASSIVAFTTTSIPSNSIYPVINIPDYAGTNEKNPQIPLNTLTTFSGAASQGNITSWQWDFSDGDTAFGAVVTHKFSQSSATGGNWAKLTVSGPNASPKQASISFTLRGAGIPVESKSNTALDPVNSATGGFVLGLNPMSIQARGLPFSFQAYYNSMSYRAATSGFLESAPGSLGYGWTHTFETCLKHDIENGTRYVMIIFGDGHSEKYVQSSDSNWLPEAGIFSRLEETQDGRFFLTTHSQIKHQFDSSGKLITISDRNENTLRLVWETVPNTTGAGNITRIAHVILPGGPTDGSIARKVLFHYRIGSPTYLWKIEDEMHHVVEFTQDAKHDLTAVTNQNLHTTNYTYDDKHQILTETNSRGHQVVKNYYDPTTRRVYRQEDVSGNVGLLSYNFPEDSTSVRTTTITRLADPSYAATDPRNEVTTDIHDVKLRLIQHQVKLENSADPAIPIALTEKWDYDPVTHEMIRYTDRRSNATNPVGPSSEFTYRNGNLTQKKNRDGGVTTYAYTNTNNSSLPTLITFQDTRVKEFREYDIRGNPTFSTFPYDPAQPQLYRRTYTPDAYGQIASVTDANGHTTESFYNEWGYLWKTKDAEGHIATAEFNDIGQTRFTTDKRGHRTEYVLDAMGHVKETRLPNPEDLTPDHSNLLVITQEYDENENRIWSKDPLGHFTYFDRDAQDRIWRTRNHEGHAAITRFDVFGRAYETENAKHGITTYKYNFAGHLLETVNPKLNKLTYSRDANGNVLSQIDDDGVKNTFSYDAMDRAISSKRWKTSTEFEETQTSYNLLGQKEWDQDVKAGLPRRTFYYYNLAGDHERSVDRDAKEFSTKHDKEGSMTTATHPTANTREDKHTPRYQLSERSDENGKLEKFFYDPAGNLERHINADLQETTFVHDELNRLTRINPPTGPPIIFKYDGAGRRRQMDDSTGITKWEYTNLDQVESIEMPSGLKLGFHHDPSGNIDQVTYPGDKTANYIYDTANRFQSVTDWQNREISQTYTPAGRPLSLRFPNGIHSDFGHDTEGRLDDITHQKGLDSALLHLGYHYNEVGELDKTPDFVLTEPDGDLPRTYGKANELLTIAGLPVTHDNRGNITGAKLNTASAVNDSLAWDYASRLTSGSIGGTAFTNTYNGLGCRVSTSRAGVSTGFLTDCRSTMARVMVETDAADTVTAYYLYAGNVLLARILTDGTVSYYHGDHQGGIVLMTDSTGSSVAHYQYDPFGVLASSSGPLASSNHFRYLGGLGVWDNLDGTLHARARTYHPLLGRFLSRDPLFGNQQDGQSLNRYVYALNDPFGFTDASGLSPISENVYAGSGVLRLTKSELLNRIAREQSELIILNAELEGYANAQKNLWNGLKAVPNALGLNPVAGFTELGGALADSLGYDPKVGTGLRVAAHALDFKKGAGKFNNALVGSEILSTATENATGTIGNFSKALGAVNSIAGIGFNTGGSLDNLSDIKQLSKSDGIFRRYRKNTNLYDNLLKGELNRLDSEITLQTLDTVITGANNSLNK